MEYIIVSEASDEKLVQKINNMMKNGWKLYQGPFSRNHLTIQAMTKGEYVRPARLKKESK